jgi:hypothetical protein
LRSNTYLSHEEILEHKAQLKEILADTKEPLVIIRAINSLTRLAKLRPANLPDQDEEYLSQDHFNIQQGSTPGSNIPSTALSTKLPTDEIVSQPIDSQSKKCVSNYLKPQQKLWPQTVEPQSKEEAKEAIPPSKEVDATQAATNSPFPEEKEAQPTKTRATPFKARDLYPTSVLSPAAFENLIRSTYLGEVSTTKKQRNAIV